MAHKDYDKNIWFFFSGSTFLQFTRSIYFLIEQISIFSLYFLIEKIFIFQEVLFSHRTYYINFPGVFIFSSNRYQFSREPLFSYRIDIHFSGSLIAVLEHIFFSRRSHALNRYFQEGNARRTDISLIGLGGCFHII